MSVRVRYHGDRLGGQLNDAAARAVQRSAALLVTRARLLANTPAKRTRMKRRRDTTSRGGGRAGSQYTKFTPSRPGQPPALRTGFGRRNIDMEFYRDKLMARVGVRSNAIYMIYLELGTRRIPKRPWLKRAMEDTRQAIETILRARLKQAAATR